MLYFQDNSWKSLKVAGDLAYHLVFILLVFLFSLVIVCAYAKRFICFCFKKRHGFQVRGFSQSLYPFNYF